MSALTDKIFNKNTVNGEKPSASENTKPPKTDTLNNEQTKEITEPPKKEEYIYSCPASESYSLHLKGGEIRARRGVMVVTKEQHEEIQALIRSGRPDIAQNALLLDPEAAEAIAREHIEREKQRNSVGKGATSTAMAKARERSIEGHILPDRLADLEVQEEGVMHADDSSLNPDGSNADNINRENGQQY